MTDFDSRQSILIKAMRFPLIALVVFAHSLGFESAAITNELSGWNIYHFFSEMISHNFAKLAVCWFFVFSGYFFFRNLKEGEYCFKWVVGKWKKRIKSLLIPYVIWNLLMVGIWALVSFVFLKIGIGTHNSFPELNPVAWFWSGPANFPLYFMRDLMLLSITAPIWYQVVKRFKWASICILIIYYVSPIEPSIPGMRGIFFFGIGAWLGIWHYNMLEISRRIKLPAAILAIISLLLFTYFNSSPYHPWMLRAFYPFGMITFMNIFDKLIDNEFRCKRLCSLASAVFFIFAAHEILILGWTKGLFLRVFGDGLTGAWISYLGVPIVVLAVCLALFWILNKLMPKTLSFICGSR